MQHYIVVSRQSGYHFLQKTVDLFVELTEIEHKILIKCDLG